MILFHNLWNGINLASSKDCGLIETVGESCCPCWAGAEVSPGGDGLALHPKAYLMCIAVWFLVEGRGCSVSLSLLFLSVVPGGRRKNGGSGHCFCVPVIEMALCQRDFLRLCPRAVGSEPKGQNITLSRERASCPLSLPFCWDWRVALQVRGDHRQSPCRGRWCGGDRAWCFAEAEDHEQSPLGILEKKCWRRGDMLNKA